ncbi:MAG: DoxX family membrane protein [Actinobacteria bacterium]|nr:DoxX family membrane protein [Actinomycetota bacterium]
MEIAVPLIRALLVGVFAVAGVAKLADLEGSRATLAGFGLPDALARPAGMLLPLAELGAATLLLFGGTARAGAIAAAALLAVFCLGIANALRRGERPDCHCFGRLHSEPAGAKTLLRNGALGGLAVIAALAGSGPGAGLEDVSLISGGVLAGRHAGNRPAFVARRFTLARRFPAS